MVKSGFHEGSFPAIIAIKKMILRLSKITIYFRDKKHIVSINNANCISERKRR